MNKKKLMMVAVTTAFMLGAVAPKTYASSRGSCQQKFENRPNGQKGFCKDLWPTLPPNPGQPGNGSGGGDGNNPGGGGGGYDGNPITLGGGPGGRNTFLGGPSNGVGGGLPSCFYDPITGREDCGGFQI